MAHIQSRSHGNESPLGSVTPFSVYQSICLLQLERLATLTVAWRLLPSLHPNVHTSSSQSVQPNTVEMRYLRQQFQVAAVSQVPKSLSLAGSVYVWFSKSGTAKSMVSTCLLAYTQNEPAPFARYYGFQWRPNSVQWVLRSTSRGTYASQSESL